MSSKPAEVSFPKELDSTSDFAHEVDSAFGFTAKQLVDEYTLNNRWSRASSRPSTSEKPIAGDDDTVYPSKGKAIIVIAALNLSVLLLALDQTILAPALGAITSEFGTVKDIGVSSKLCQSKFKHALLSRCADTALCGNFGI